MFTAGMVQEDVKEDVFDTRKALNCGEMVMTGLVDMEPMAPSEEV